MLSHIIIPDQGSLDFKLHQIRSGGLNNISIISDFDRTLTYAKDKKNQDTPTSASLLQKMSVLPQSSVDQLQEYYLKYRAKEIDLLISDAEKTILMEEWWTKVFNIYIKLAIQKQAIQKQAIHQTIIHSLNKTEKTVQHKPFYQEVASRKNIVLLGDSIHDPQMVNDSKHNSVLRIGFLNSHEDQLLKTYQSLYDVVILKDQDLDYVINLIDSI